MIIHIKSVKKVKFLAKIFERELSIRNNDSECRLLGYFMFSCVEMHGSALLSISIIKLKVDEH